MDLLPQHPLLKLVIILAIIYLVLTLFNRVQYENFKKRSSNSKRSTGSKGDFVVFKATWCGHCKVLKPVLLELLSSYKGPINIVVLDADADQAKMDTISLICCQSIQVVLAMPVLSLPD